MWRGASSRHKTLTDNSQESMISSNLTQLVRNIYLGKYTQAELLQFITLVQKIAVSYLKYQEVMGKRISGERLETDVEIEDLAIDCVADLFAGDENGGFPQLKKYYENKFIEFVHPTDAEILVLTRRLIVRKTKQELSRIFRERDPEGAKIVRNIKVAVRNSDVLFLFKDMGKEYVYFRNNGYDSEYSDINFIPSYLRRSNPSIPEELLKTRFLDLHNPNDSISISINKLLNTLTEYKGYQDFLAVEVVARLIRNVKYVEFRERIMANNWSESPFDHLEDKEIIRLRERVMIRMWDKIHNQYFLTGKITKDKAEIYYKALRDVLTDLTHDRDGSSYFRNLKFYIPALTQKTYREQERSIFEYLAKVAKRRFRKHLTEIL